MAMVPDEQGIFYVLIVSGTGQGSGFFLYNGTPGLGNLVAQMVAPGTTLDPFGNTVNAVLNVGSWSVLGALLQHFGIDANGRVFIVGPDGVTRIQINNGFAGTGPDIRFFNDFGAVILIVDPNRGGTFQYQDNNSAVQGVLIGAQVGKNTTDPVFGGAVNAGITLSDPAFGDQLLAVGANISLTQALFTLNAIITANTGSGATSPFLHLAGPEQSQAGHAVLRLYGKSVDGTKAGGVIVSLTDPPVRQVAEALEVQGNVAVTGQVKAVLSSALETWHTVGAGGQPAFGANFTSTGAPFAPVGFQFEPVNGGRVRLRGQVTLTAAQVAGATIFTLPAGYVPAFKTFWSVPSTLSGGFNSGFIVQVLATGAVQIVVAGANTNVVQLDGIVLELD